MHYCLSKADAKQPGARLNPKGKLHTARQEFYEVEPRDRDLDLVNAYLLQEQGDVAWAGSCVDKRHQLSETDMQLACSKQEQHHATDHLLSLTVWAGPCLPMLSSM